MIWVTNAFKTQSTKSVKQAVSLHQDQADSLLNDKM